jgi:hypothetical protein
VLGLRVICVFVGELHGIEIQVVAIAIRRLLRQLATGNQTVLKVLGLQFELPQPNFKFLYLMRQQSILLLKLVVLLSQEYVLELQIVFFIVLVGF